MFDFNQRNLSAIEIISGCSLIINQGGPGTPLHLVTKNQPFGSLLTLDGTVPHDPPFGALSYQWFGPFNPLSGPTPTMYVPEGQSTISLLVSDASVGSSQSDITVSVVPCFVPEVRSKVDLVWAHLNGADRYEIYRASETDPFHFAKLGETTSAYSTFLDTPPQRNPLANVRLAFLISRSLGGTAIRTLGVVVENAVGRILVQIPGAVVTRNIGLVGAGGRRVIDFLVQVGNRVALIEVNYGLPRQVGPALTRLVGQMQTALTASQLPAGTQIVLFTFRAPTAAQMNLLLQQLGPQAGLIQNVSGLWGLVQWARFFFLAIP